MSPFWRWVLVLPASVGAFVGVNLAITIGNNLSWTEASAPDFVWLKPFFIYFMTYLVSPYCFVMAGAKCAPRLHLPVGLGLTILWAVWSGALVSKVLMGENFHNPRWMTLTGAVLGIGSTIVALIQLHQEEESL
jgi:hypothetical protein